MQSLKGVVTMAGLILEGGTFRPIFSCGVMDALLEEDIMFPYCIGVSAGISDAVSYVSKQHGRNLEIAKRFRSDKRYIGAQNLKNNGSIFGMDFIFDAIPNKYIPFDYDTFYSYPGTFLIGVTNARTAKAHYVDGKTMDHTFRALRATCALPMVIPPVRMKGGRFVDGGVADPIPVRKSIEDGNEKNLIVLTRPKGYRKNLERRSFLAAKALRYKYPALSQLLLKRHIAYNETVAFCEKLEREGKALILRPEYPLHSLEKDVNVLESSYEHGRTLAKKNMDIIRSLLS